MFNRRSPLLLLIILGLASSAKGERLLSAEEREKSEETILMGPGAYEASNGRLVKDPDARSGWAMVADPADKPGAGHLWYGYTYSQLPGRVRATYRVKVADNTIDEPVVSVHKAFAATELKHDPRADVAIKGAEFLKADTYQDFPLELPRGEAGFGEWSVGTSGKTRISFDGVQIEQLSLFDPDDLLPLVNVPQRPTNLALGRDRRPKDSDDDVIPVLEEDPALGRDPFRVHETIGLFAEMWGVKQAAGLLAIERTQSYFYDMSGQWVGLRDFPRTWEDLYRHRAVVLNNVPAKVVTIVGALMLKQFIEDGGTVLLMGDTHGLIAGKWPQSPLGPLLPVMSDTSSPEAIYSPQPLYLQSRGNSFKGMNWEAKPYTVYYHKAALRPGSRVLLAVGEIPLVVEGRVGKGRIVVLLTSVLGEKIPKAPGIPWWEWKNWPALMADLLETRSLGQ